MSAHATLPSIHLVPDAYLGLVKIWDERRIEVWGEHIEEHFLITIDDQQQPNVDIIFIAPSSGEYLF